MKNEIIIALHKNFEEYAHQVDGEEYWFARELQGLLGYTQWRNFEQVIDKAKIACQTAGHLVNDHFADVSKIVDIGSGAERKIEDIMLTRYACYLDSPEWRPAQGAHRSGNQAGRIATGRRYQEAGAPCKVRRKETSKAVRKNQRERQ